MDIVAPAVRCGAIHHSDVSIPVLISATVVLATTDAVPTKPAKKVDVCVLLA